MVLKVSTVVLQHFDEVVPLHGISFLVERGEGAEGVAQAREAVPEGRPVVQVQTHELLEVYLRGWLLLVHLVSGFDH